MSWHQPDALAPQQGTVTQDKVDRSCFDIDAENPMEFSRINKKLLANSGMK
jgi:hypothetical protein